MSVKTNGVRRSGFTLVELLVAVAIVVIVFTLALPAFQGIGRGASMRTAVSQVRAAISLARQHAIVNRTRTYIVFPQQTSEVQGQNNRQRSELILRSFNIFSEKESDYLKAWTTLPKGVLFVEGVYDVYDIDRDNTDIFTDPNPNNTKHLLPFPAATNSTVELRGLVFKPDGSCDIGSDPEIFLAEGSVLIDEAGNIVSVDYRLPLESTALHGIQIREKTGRTRVYDYRDFTR